MYDYDSLSYEGEGHCMYVPGVYPKKVLLLGVEKYA